MTVSTSSPVPLTSEDWARISEFRRLRDERLERERRDLQQRARAVIQPQHSERAVDFLERACLEVSPFEFYNSIFRGYLDVPDEMNVGAYTGIVVEKLPTDEHNKRGFSANRYTITDG